MLIDPAKVAPFKFNRRRLGVQIMDGTQINFEDNFFDIVFSYSAIEHFGSKDVAIKTMKEIERVLKPGGVASIATEVFIGSNYDVLNKERDKGYSILSEIFTPEEIEECLLHSTNMKTYNDIDYHVEESDLDTVINFPDEINRTPHIILKYRGVKWSSIHLVFIKYV